MNSNQQCVITILRDHGDQLTTSQILDYTKNYPDLCRGCSSGTQVISAGIQLMEMGLIKREIGKGGFKWSLTNQE